MTTKAIDDIHLIKWPTSKVLAISTTRCIPHSLSKLISAKFLNSNINKKVLSDFDDFNLGAHVGDSAENVVRNRQALVNFFPSQTNIQWLEQVHGSHVAYIDKHSEKAIIADAVITRRKNLALAIMTADCLPILLADKSGREIAAIHAGWRPLAGKIIENTISKMQTPVSDIYAWLGPCIGPQAFEVGEEVKQSFIQISKSFSSAFLPVTNTCSTHNQTTKYLADMVMIATLQLKQCGVENIAFSRDCTFTESDKYYSFRRDGRTGRMASIISLT